MINDVNYDLVCQSIKDYILNHNILENYRLVTIIMQLCNSEFST